MSYYDIQTVSSVIKNIHVLSDLNACITPDNIFTMHNDFHSARYTFSSASDLIM